MTRDRKQYAIASHRELQWVIRTLADTVGGLRALARATGLSDALLSLLARGRRKRLAPGTYDALRDAIGRVSQRRVRSTLKAGLRVAVTAPAALDLDERWRNWALGRRTQYVLDGQATFRHPAPALLSILSRGMEHELPTIRRQDQLERRDALTVLYLKAYRGSPVLPRFFAWCRDRDVDQLRYYVAIVRILEPLAEAEDAGGVEPGWDRLTRRERTAFLWRGVQREQLLIRKSVLPGTR